MGWKERGWVLFFWLLLFTQSTPTQGPRLAVPRFVQPQAARRCCSTLEGSSGADSNGEGFFISAAVFGLPCFRDGRSDCCRLDAQNQHIKHTNCHLFHLLCSALFRKSHLQRHSCRITAHFFPRVKQGLQKRLRQLSRLLFVWVVSGFLQGIKTRKNIK